MNRYQRLALDRKTFKRMGFKKIKHINLYNYYNDYERAVTVYTVKDKKGYMTQTLFPIELNPVSIWDTIQKEITLKDKIEILDHRYEYQESGLVYNVMCEETILEQSIQKYIFVKYDPITKAIEIKEIAEDGFTDNT